MKFLLFAITVTLGFSVYAQERPSIVIEPIQGPTPWTSLDLNNDQERFQFVIVTDRTGGRRPGVFKQGVDKINLLQPEFVMSVGDLIDGYTYDRDELIRQWDEFDGFVSELEMPFFYVPGNHDITNWTMDSLWTERYGPKHYHFIYQDVLFLALNSEDQARGAGRGTISDTQYEWVAKVLEENKDVKWTLVFMHQPLWHQNNPERWPDLEKLLASRKHTVFTGHEHRYVKAERNNGKYFVLATTGGGSSLRGPELGEFDHVVWVTMSEEGPIIANLHLNGIWDENIVQQDAKDYITSMFRKRPLSIKPMYLNEEQESVEVEIKIVNDENIPMEIEFNEEFSWDIIGFVEEKEMEIAPNDVQFIKLHLQPRKNSWEKPFPLSAQISYKELGHPDIKIPLKYNVKPLSKYSLSSIKKAKIDGKAKEWSSYTNSIELSNGKKAQFEVAADDEGLVIGVFVEDDQINVDTKSSPWNDDHLRIHIDANPIAESAMNSNQRNREESLYLVISPEIDGATPPTYGNMLGHAEVRSVLVEGGIFTEVRVPTDYITDKQGANWKNVRVNLAVGDNDGDGTAVTWWQPEWRSADNIVGSGMFFK
jgi:hypothetical protein